MTDFRKLLIVRLSSLGDIIHTLPAYQSLRTAFPEARIDWLVERKLAFLLGAVDGIDEILPIDTHAMRKNLARPEGWQMFWEPIRAARARRYDVAIDFQGLLKTAFLSLLSGATTRIGFSRPLVRERAAHWLYHRTPAEPGSPMHVVRLNLLLAGEAGARSGELRVRLTASDEDTRTIESLLRREQLSEFVVLNPGGGWPTKRWKPACYGSLASRIEKELQLKTIVVTGPGEELLYQQITETCTEPLPAHFHVPFLQLIPLLRSARLLVAGDTGPLHLACALGAPVVGIMGPTSPVRNGPWSEIDEVVVHHLPCSFCNGRSCPTANECMDISVEEVFAAVVRRLQRTKQAWPLP
jgi:lipopolysaccharide heptosyltransferase I